MCSVTYPDASVFCAADGATLILENGGNDLVGSVVADRYLVERLLGEGGMGRVYLARHVRLPQQAAIKVLHPGMIADPEAVARFNREAANAARIENDRVARVFDFGETREGSVYLAMEYVPGRSLHALISDVGRLSPVRAARITYQVAEGLDAAHRIGIVHRDLKPDNIMVVTDESGADRCKVVDFGIAKAADSGSRTRLTRTGMIVGTPEFMSPEQFLGEELDARSDVYALALVAYNALTGTLPFVAATPERAMAARMMEAPRPLAEALPGQAWPAELQAVFDRALDRDPGNRTASALEFGEAVVAAVEAWTGEAVLRGRTPLNTRAVTPSSSVAVPTSRATPAGVPMAPPPTPASTPAGDSRSRALVVGVAVVLLAIVGYIATRRPEAPTAAPGLVTETPAQASDTAIQPNVPQRRPVGPDGAAPTPQLASPAASPLTPPTGSQTTATNTTALETDPGALAERDSLQEVLRDDASGEAEARAAIPALERLLPRMANATDSTWTYLALVNAHGQAGSPSTRACTALRNAERLAATAAQRAMVTNLFDSPVLACVR
ncbi:MAG: protein kinase [Gemmatimonadetes bacterium]|nr:protein kinase [Gemmatimonadota bacterium]